MINMIHIICMCIGPRWRDGWGCSEKCCAETLHRHPPPFTPLPADADSWCEVSEKEGLRVSYKGRSERIGRLLTQKTTKNWCSLNIFLLNNNELLNGLMVVTGCPIRVVRSVHLIYSNWSGKDHGASCVYYGFLPLTIVYRITLFAPRKYSGIWLPEINGDGTNPNKKI